MLTFCNLFSSSSGNATYIGTERDAVLVDCGLSCKQILEAMQKAGLDAGRVRGILITHAHSDHVKGAGVLSRRLGVPVIATAGCHSEMEKALGELPLQHRVTIGAGESFFAGSLECQSFTIPHDAADPVGYRVFTAWGSAACATDMGYFTDTAASALSGTDVILLESNHDPDMLRENPNYPSRLKSRILGKKGHLSNESGAEAAVRLLSEGTQHILLGHLSKENNTPELAYATSLDRITATGAVQDHDFTLHVASRLGPTRVYRLGEEDPRWL